MKNNNTNMPDTQEKPELITQALNVEGWMTEPELTWLHEHASKSQCVLEMGCWAGRSTTTLCAATNVIAVDHWHGDWYMKMWLGKKYESELVRIRESFFRNHQARIDSGQLSVVEISTATATGIFELLNFLKANNLTPDMVFVDATHDYQSAKDDIELAKLISTPDALLCGHDYCSGYPGVVEAVDELFPGHVRPTNADSLWQYRKGSSL